MLRALQPRRGRQPLLVQPLDLGEVFLLCLELGQDDVARTVSQPVVLGVDVAKIQVVNTATPAVADDPLKFPDIKPYPERLKAARKASGEPCI